MKYAITADIHGNLAALQAVMKDADNVGCTAVACLGDIVGGYGDPNGCIDLLRQRRAVCVKGNFDEYCCGDGPLDDFQRRAAGMIAWTRERLGRAERDWLRGLNYVEAVDGFTIVHATLDGPAQWSYVFEKAAAAASFVHQTTPVCFFGHTHVPVCFIKDSVVRGGSYTKVKVEPERAYFVSVGSVGQPRDGTVLPAYATYDLESATIELRRPDFETPEGDSPASPVTAS